MIVFDLHLLINQIRDTKRQQDVLWQQQATTKPFPRLFLLPLARIRSRSQMHLLFRETPPPLSDQCKENLNHICLFGFPQNKKNMLPPSVFDMPGRSASRARNLLYGMLISQLLTTGLGSTLPEGILTLKCKCWLFPYSFSLLEDMKPLKTKTLVEGVKTFVPPNYALSFNITPTGLVSKLSSILHYTKDNSDNGPLGRIPGMLQFPQPYLTSQSYLPF